MLFDFCRCSLAIYYHVEAVNPVNSCEPGIFLNLILATAFKKTTATERKLPNMSTEKGTIVEFDAVSH